MQQRVPLPWRGATLSLDVAEYVICCGVFVGNVAVRGVGIGLSPSTLVLPQAMRQSGATYFQTDLFSFSTFSSASDLGGELDSLHRRAKEPKRFRETVRDFAIAEYQVALLASPALRVCCAAASLGRVACDNHAGVVWRVLRRGHVIAK